MSLPSSEGIIGEACEGDNGLLGTSSHLEQLQQKKMSCGETAMQCVQKGKSSDNEAADVLHGEVAEMSNKDEIITQRAGANKQLSQVESFL